MREQRGIPTMRGRTSAKQNVGAVSKRIPTFRSAAVLLVLFIAIADQSWRPSAAREREVLSGQIDESVERLDQLQAHRLEVEQQRDAAAAGKSVFPLGHRYFGEPIRSSEHAVYLCERRIANVNDDIARVVADGQRYSAALDAIDRNGGRRVPFTNRFFAWISARVTQ